MSTSENHDLFEASTVIGPILAGGFGQAILQGILFCQTSTYVQEYVDSSRWINILVAFINCASAAQTYMCAYEWWRVFVLCFDERGEVMIPLWMDMIQPLMTSLMSVPVHIYFAHRCWKATNRNPWVVAYLGVLILATLVTSISVAARGMQTVFGPLAASSNASTDDGDMDSSALSESLELILPFPLSIPRVIWLASSAVLDLSVTIILFTYLVRTKTKTYSQQFHSVIDDLIWMVWSCGIPPCCCALAMCITYVILVRWTTLNYWTFFLQDLLGKLHCLSLLETLNNRSQLGEDVNLSSHGTYRCDTPGIVRIEIDRDSLGESRHSRSYFDSEMRVVPSVTVLGKTKRFPSDETSDYL